MALFRHRHNFAFGENIQNPAHKAGFFIARIGPQEALNSPKDTPMAEPTSAAASVVLGKYGVVMAAFIGSILSLGFLKDLTRFQAATAVATGFGFSVYLTQPVTAWLAPKLELAVTDDLLCGVAFVLGLTAMNIIPAIKAAMGSFVTARGA